MPVFLFGRTPKWECERCGETYRSNPQECSNCEHTIFKKYTEDSGSSSSASSGSSGNSPWACTRCGHRHDRKPFTCDNCGGNSIRELATVDKRTTHSTASPPPTPGSGPTFVTDVVWLLVMLASAFFAYHVFF